MSSSSTSNNNKSYRIRANTYVDENVVNVQLTQDYDTFEILSLKLTQSNAYKLYESNYGVIVGRVMANGGFGIPNAKISVFIAVDNEDSLDNDKNYLYPYTSTLKTNNDGVRYNLLTSEKVDNCHQNVGTFPTKRMILDNDTVLEIYDKYYKWTTTTNQSGDYMLFGIPTGMNKIHVDVDLSDIGILSQRPYDMIYKGYNINQFESPNMFKTSTNLDSLAQIYTQDKGVYVYPFWGDSGSGSEEGQDRTIAITRADVQLQYQFEPTCVFMGSIISDSTENAIGKNCVAEEKCGNMADMITGEGTIEVIRKTSTGQIEEFQIQGTRLIDGDGVWCFQIPMNLDYVTTDEYGNMVQTDDPTKGIPTRTRVRFRISMDDSPNDSTNRKRCKYLVPNNPQVEQTNATEEEDMTIFDKEHKIDYEFGTATRDDSFRDMFWNKVYTVKSYIPRIQKESKTEYRKFTGIKLTNQYGSNNPMPYNNAHLKLTLIFRFLCVVMKIFIYLVTFLNAIISILGWIPCILCEKLGGNKILNIFTMGLIKVLTWPFCKVSDLLTCIKIDKGFCDDGINNFTFYPGCLDGLFGCVWDKTQEKHIENETEELKEQGYTDEDIALMHSDPVNDETDYLMNCIENNLAQSEEVVSFDFYNDWVNGVLYAPLWHRYIRKKKSFLFGLIKRKAKDDWCSAERTSFSGLRLFQPCALTYETDTTNNYLANNGDKVDPFYKVKETYNDNGCFSEDEKKQKCYNKTSSVSFPNGRGIIVPKLTMLGQTVYYYKPIEYVPAAKGKQGTVITLFATDIVLLGSLNECDLDGTPQFFKFLEGTTFNKPTDILFTDNVLTQTEDGTYDREAIVEATGADWGNYSESEQCGSDDDKQDGGLFYGIGCAHIEMMAKSCVNLQRICELGVNIDQTKIIEDLVTGIDDDDKNRLVADGFISKDELYGDDARSMFATMNGNELRTIKDDSNGLYRYDFHYLYPENFDGSLQEIMQERQTRCGKSYRYNYMLELYNEDYYKFRLGKSKRPTYYTYGNVVDKDAETSMEWTEGTTLGTFPRYNNSFYFYFGLHPGKTAIDKFNSQFYAPCDTVVNDAFDVGIQVSANTWCDQAAGELSGGITLTFGDMELPYEVIVHREDIVGGVDLQYTGKTDEILYIGYAEDADPRDTDGNPPLANGTYTITITDNAGNIVTKTIELSAEKLGFTLSGVMSNTDNDTLMEMYNNDCNAIREAKAGGQVIVTNIAVDNELMCSEKDTCGEDERIYRIYFYELVDELDENGLKVTKEVPIELTDEEAKTGILQFCQGDRRFKVVIVEMCDGVESDNRVEQIIYVGEPGKFKLYINEVDYDIIKRFHTGYDDPDHKNIGKFCGWDKISQVDNPYYDWPKEITDMEIELAGKFNERTGAVYTPEEIQEEIYQAKQDIISKVKSAFWMSCPDNRYKIALRTDFGQPVILYQIAYDKEVQVEDETQEDGYRTDLQWAGVENTQYVFDIEIPTLLRIDSEESGTVVGNNYAKLNDKKKPYWVAAFSNYNQDTFNENSARRPIKAEVGNANTFFGVHLMDKLFALEVVSWAWVIDKHIWQVFKPTENNNPEDTGEGEDPSGETGGGNVSVDDMSITFDDVSDLIIDQTGGTAVRTATGYNVKLENLQLNVKDDWAKAALSGSGNKYTATFTVEENTGDSERRTTATFNVSGSGTGEEGGGEDPGGDEGGETVDDGIYNAGNYGGFLQGYIINGITERQDDKNVFERIICGNVVPIYQNDTPVEYEDAMPTKRKILGPPYEKGSTRHECLTNEGVMRLPYDSVTFEIDDFGACNLVTEIHASMEITVVSSYGDPINNTNELQVSVSNSLPDGLYYVLIEATDGVFPFPMFDPCTGAIYKYEVTSDDINERGITQRWDMGRGEGEQDYKYVIDGKFKFDGQRAVYVVVYDEENCRQLSEVYDFRTVIAEIGVTNSLEQFQSQIGGVVGGEGTNPDTGDSESTDEPIDATGNTGVAKYALTVKFKTNQWYICNYNSNFNVTYGNPDSGGNSLTFAGAMKGKEVETDPSPIDYTYTVEINQAVFNAIKSILKMTDLANMRTKTLNKYVLVEVIDCLGIELRCVLEPGEIVEFDVDNG